MAGDFFTTVPEVDIYLPKHIIYDWDDQQSTLILSKLRAGDTTKRTACAHRALDAGRWSREPRITRVSMFVVLPGRERTMGEYAGLIALLGTSISGQLRTSDQGISIINWCSTTPCNRKIRPDRFCAETAGFIRYGLQ
jgi:O-methyltransferase domain